MEALARQQADADRMAQRLLAEEEAAKARKAEREKEVQRVREAQREKAREKARKKKEKKKDRKKKGAQGKPTEVSEDEDEEGPAASSQPGSGSAAAGAGPSVAQLPLGSHGIADNRSDSEEDGWELAGSRTAGSSSRTRGLPARASITSQGDAQQGHALGRVISEDGAELDGWTAVGAASGAFSVLSENHRSASSAPSAPPARPGPTIERSEMWRSIDAAMEARDQPRLEAALRTASYWLATHTSSPLASELRPKMNEGRNLLKQLSERVQQRAGPSGRGSVPQAAPIRSQPAPSLVASSAAATSGAGRVASPGPLPSRAPVAAGRSGGYAVPAAGGRGQGVGGRGAAPPAPPPQRGAPHYGGMPRGPPTGLAPAVAALFSANAQAAAAAPAAPGVANARVRSPPPYGGPSAAFLGQSAQYRPPLQPQRPTPAPAPLRFVPPEPFAAQTGLSPGGQDGGQEDEEEYRAWKAKYPCLLTHFELFTKQAENKRVAVFLDYDGTLTPIVKNPDRAFMSDQMRAQVQAVAQLFPTAIISGRGREKVESFVQLKELYYAGSHGMDIVGPRVGDANGGQLAFQPAAEFEPVMDTVHAMLVHRVQDIEGASVEHNKFCVSVHFRNCAPSSWDAVVTAVETTLKEHPQLKATRGRKVLEIRPQVDWDKGRALSHLLTALGLDAGEDVLAIYIGDDRTDEDAFSVLNEQAQGFGILVSSKAKATQAKYTLRDPAEVMAFLTALVDWGYTSSNAWHNRGLPATYRC
ncbi:hypothetical protein WJX72_001803 [[Myrmecia] bisecta]|uniref:trehalose-phosphatase n=1 Tax=[Myrmecia] bisecta TaxID=41462 RepID=A0AAW1P4L7_9CHLO